MNRGQTVRPSNRGLEFPWLDYNTLEQQKNFYLNKNCITAKFFNLFLYFRCVPSQSWLHLDRVCPYWQPCEPDLLPLRRGGPPHQRHLSLWLCTDCGKGSWRCKISVLNVLSIANGIESFASKTSQGAVWKELKALIPFLNYKCNWLCKVSVYLQQKRYSMISVWSTKDDWSIYRQSSIFWL